MEIEIIEQPIQFHLFGLSSVVGEQSYGEVGCRLMNEVWHTVHQAQLKTTGINHWVYFSDDRMLVGVVVLDAEQSRIPAELEECELELLRYSKHIHIGPYNQLPEKWQALRAELESRGERITSPSLEVYGYSCEGDDDSQAETTILMGLKSS